MSFRPEHLANCSNAFLDREWHKSPWPTRTKPLTARTFIHAKRPPRRKLKVPALVGGYDGEREFIAIRHLAALVIHRRYEAPCSGHDVEPGPVRAHQNNAGIFGTVTRIGRPTVGHAVFLHAAV